MERSPTLLHQRVNIEIFHMLTYGETYVNFHRMTAFIEREKNAKMNKEAQKTSIVFTTLHKESNSRGIIASGLCAY